MSSPAQQTVLITGAAKRIGRDIAWALAGQGYNIALHYNHSRQQAEELAASIEKKHSVRCQTFPVDLMDTTSTTDLVPRVIKHFGRLDVLINNASIFEPGQIRSAGLPHLRRHMTVNFEAPYILITTFVQHSKTGHIINILDAQIACNSITHTPYLLSKKALADLTLLAAQECAPAFRVNGICPGPILPAPGKTMEDLQRRAKAVPLKHHGDTQDIGAAVTFLLQQSFITGNLLYVDGGSHLQ